MLGEHFIKLLNQNNMEQTAVDWLINEIIAKDWWYLPESMKQDIIEQAKAMEKEQIGYSEIDLEVAFFEGSIHNLTFNQWLEQFKNQKNNL
jgi:hypothetical protein